MTLKLTSRGFDKLLARVSRIEQALRSAGTLKRQLGKLLTEQTKRRITTEKATPDGRPWAKWSKEYAATRSSGHSLLIDSRALLEGIKARVTADGASVTADVDYSAAVNKRRQFLGVSRKNKSEIEALVDDWAKRTLQ